MAQLILTHNGKSVTEYASVAEAHAAMVSEYNDVFSAMIESGEIRFCNLTELDAVIQGSGRYYWKIN